MNQEIQQYNLSLHNEEQDIGNLLATLIDRELTNATSKIWHAHPVWFLDDNPIVGYSKQKKGIRLMFWSGKDFEEENLPVPGGKFRDASIFYHHPDEIDLLALRRWLQKSIIIQWDYKNLVKRKGELIRLC